VHGAGLGSSNFHLHTINIDIIYDINTDIDIDTYKPFECQKGEYAGNISGDVSTVVGVQIPPRLP